MTFHHRFCTVMLAFGVASAFATRIVAQSSASPEILLRLDDVGMNHSVNSAIARVAESGLAFSVTASSQSGPESSSARD